MPPTDENAQPKARPATPDRTFRVIKGQYGPWPINSVFAESEFKRLHGIPKNDLAEAQIDKATYHTDLIGRAIALGVIELAPNAETTPTPAGPEAVTITRSNETIQASTARVMKQRAEDQAAATISEQTAAPLHTGATQAPVLKGGMQATPQPPQAPQQAAPPQ